METRTLVGLVKFNAGADQTIMLHDSRCPMVNRGNGKAATVTEADAHAIAEDCGGKVKRCKCCKT